jgi:RNase P subunit RPR2
MSEKETTQAQAARRIAGLLASAEDAAKQGNEKLRDNYLEKASALQLQYAIDDVMAQRAGQADADTIISARFCEESNTPLVKAKRILINTVANHARGKAVLRGAWKTRTTGQRKGERMWDKRAYVEVFAHESDLAFITALYTSLIVQMQTMMAADESGASPSGQPPMVTGKVTSAWRVSYAHGWVTRIGHRLQEMKARQERDVEISTPGTALVLRDRDALVMNHVSAAFGNLRTSRHPVSDRDAGGRQAGYVAGGRADLGATRVASGQRPQLGR